MGSDSHATLLSDSGVCGGVVESDIQATGCGLLGSEGSCSRGRRGAARLGYLVRGFVWGSGVRAAFRLDDLLGGQVDLLLGYGDL